LALQRLLLSHRLQPLRRPWPQRLFLPLLLLRRPLQPLLLHPERI
jgi:hypothetical protein